MRKATQYSQGPQLDIDGLNKIVVENGYHIKEELKKLGMKWDGSRWYYKPTNDDDAVKMLQTLTSQFPGMESRDQDLVDFVNSL